MKWLVYGCGLLISSAALVALSMSRVFPALGGIGSGLLTVCVYFLGVYLAPRLIIHRLQQRVSKEKPEDIVTIEPNRKPVRRDVVGKRLEERAEERVLLFTIGGNSHDLPPSLRWRNVEGPGKGRDHVDRAPGEERRLESAREEAAFRADNGRGWLLPGRF